MSGTCKVCPATALIASLPYLIYPACMAQVKQIS